MEIWDAKEILNRVYIRFEKSYEIQKKVDFNIILDAIAKNNPNGDGEILFEIDSITGGEYVYRGRTQDFLVRKTKNYIRKISCRQADETMASYVSGRQVKYIRRFLKGEKRALPAYAGVILYVAFTLIPIHAFEGGLCKEYLELLQKMVYSYSLYNSDDMLACFFEECFKLVEGTMEREKKDLPIEEFPGIPRKYPKRNRRI